MTFEERRDPGLIDSVVIQRLAATTETTREDVERAVEHFKRLPDTVRRLGRMSMWERIKFLSRLP